MRLFINKPLNLSSLPISNFKRSVFELTLSKTLISTNLPSLANEGRFVEIKVLDKVSSKTDLLKLEIGKELKFKGLLIKSLKCKNSEFDDNPEITAYIQVKDMTNKDNNEVFIFNGWTFSSSPAVNPFDHAVYDIWLTRCY